MKRLAIVLVGVLLLTGCSATDRATQALDLCVSSAEESIGADINQGELQSSNMGDALFEEGVTDNRDVDDADALFFVTGDVTWTADGKENRKSMLCSVNFEGGEPQLPVKATLS